MLFSRLGFPTYVFLASALCVPSVSASTDGLPEVGQAIAVELNSQRVVFGVVDEQTDSQQLWLRSSAAKVTLVSGFDWQRVVRWEPSSTDASKLPDQPKIVAPTEPHALTLPEPQNYIITKSPAASALDSHRNTRVVSLEVIAEVANWDGDVEPDGLRVFVRPVNAFGQQVPVRGQVSFKLMGQRPPWRNREYLRRKERFVQLGQWSRRIKPDDFCPQGCVYQLDFRNFHPDRRVDVAYEALLHVRLSVPSVGAFEASTPPIFLRPYSWLRDDLQHFTGRRYFPAEHASPRALP